MNAKDVLPEIPKTMTIAQLYDLCNNNDQNLKTMLRNVVFSISGLISLPGNSLIQYLNYSFDCILVKLFINLFLLKTVDAAKGFV